MQREGTVRCATGLDRSATEAAPWPHRCRQPCGRGWRRSSGRRSSATRDADPPSTTREDAPSPPLHDSRIRQRQRRVLPVGAAQFRLQRRLFRRHHHLTLRRMCCLAQCCALARWKPLEAAVVHTSPMHAETRLTPLAPSPSRRRLALRGPSRPPPHQSLRHHTPAAQQGHSS